MITLGNAIKNYRETTEKNNWDSLQLEEKMRLIKTAFKQIVGEKFKETKEWQDTARMIELWISKKDKEKNWLFMIGSCGMGKTVWAKAIQKAYNSTQDRKIVYHNEKNKMLRFLSTLELVQGACGNEDIYQLFRYPRLIIDDIGIEPADIYIYGTKRNIVMEFLSYRYEKNLTTIITSNLKLKNPNQIIERYGERIYDRLRGKSILIGFTGESFRK